MPASDTPPFKDRIQGLTRISAGRALLALALLEVVVVLLVWSPFPAGVWHDDGVYLLLGKALAEGDGLRYAEIAGAYPAPKFPPLYPLILAGLWAVLPGVGSVTFWATVLNVAVLAGSAVVFAWLLHRGLGAAPVVAAGISALAWLSIPLWRTALVPFSEPLFLLFLLLAAVWACSMEGSGAGGREEAVWGKNSVGSRGSGGDTADRGRPAVGASSASVPISRWIVLGVLLLVALHLRTAAVALLVAVVAALASRGRGRGALALLAAVVVGLLPWTVWSAGANAEIPEPLRDVLGSYGSWILAQMAAFPTGYLAGLEGQARDLVDRLLTLLLPLPLAWEASLAPVRWAALLLLLPALFLGFDRIWERSRTVVLFFVAYLVLVWLWPFQAMRLLAPLVPFLVLIVAAGFWWRPGGGPGPEGSDPGEDGEEVSDGKGGASAGASGIPFHPRFVRAWRWTGGVWAAAFAVISIWGMVDGTAGAGYRLRSGALARSMEAVQEVTPDDAVVGAPELWAAIPLHTGRVGTPSARFLPARPAPEGPVWGTPAEQHAIWAATGVSWLVLEQGGTIHGRALDEVTAACGPETVTVRARWPEGILIELAWDEACRERLRVQGI